MSELEALTERLDALEREQAALRDALERSESEREEYQKLYRLLREENERLRRGLLGQKAERLPPDERQLSLSVLQMLLEKGDGAAIEAIETEVIQEHVRRKPTGRKLLPDDLPRVEIELLPPEVEREGRTRSANRVADAGPGSSYWSAGWLRSRASMAVRKGLAASRC